MKKMFFVLTATAFLFSCKKDKDQEGTVFKGTEASVYQGKVWSTVKLKDDGSPEKLTLTLNAAALASVPTGEGSGDEHTEENVFLVSLPSKATETTPFKFIMVDWNPHGHEPAGIYDKPHFDLHFYMTPSSEVMTYMDMGRIENPPASDYLPANYIPGPPVPMMGKHWIDVTSPELNGQPFTQTFIYGSYDGNVVFYEPMITLDFLKTTVSFERSIPQPSKVKITGYYPTKMRVYKEPGATTVSLEDLVYRQAS